MALRIYGNRSLKTLPGNTTRPTPSRVREAVFNIWQGSIVGCHWLDLCAGSGAMGAEALCRDAASVTGIEQLGRASAIIRQNWQQVARPEQQFYVLQGHILRQLPLLSGQQFDRIYFDPPYRSNLYIPVLEAIVSYNLLASHGALAVEHQTDLNPPEIVRVKDCLDLRSLVAYRCKTYGLTSITFYDMHT